MGKDMQTIRNEAQISNMRVKGVYKIIKKGIKYTYIKII
jgi:hypothetical protein